MIGEGVTSVTLSTSRRSIEVIGASLLSAAGIFCWFDCIAEAQAVPRLGSPLTADASATRSWVQLAHLQEQAFVNPTIGMVSPAVRPALLTASASINPVTDILVAEQQSQQAESSSG